MMAISHRPESDSASLGSEDDHDESVFGSDEDIFEEESDGESTESEDGDHEFEVDYTQSLLGNMNSIALHEIKRGGTVDAVLEEEVE